MGRSGYESPGTLAPLHPLFRSQVLDRLSPLASVVDLNRHGFPDHQSERRFSALSIMTFSPPAVQHDLVGLDARSREEAFEGRQDYWSDAWPIVLPGKYLFWPLGPGKPAVAPKSARIGILVSEHPVWLAGGIVVVLASLSMGIINYTSTYNTLSELPSSTESLVAYNTLQSAFPPGALAPTQVMVDGNGPIDPNSLTNLTDRLTKAKGVSFVAPPQISADGTAALVTVLLSGNPFSQTALNDVEGPIRQAAHGSVPGESVLVGGQTSTLVDVRSSLNQDTHLVIPVAAAIIAVILGLLLLSIVAPIDLIIGVALTYAATLGASAFVFINGMDYTGIDFVNPIVLYLFVIAIGTDYNILMSDRLREEFSRGRSPKETVRVAITHGAPAVWAAGVILAGTFASLLISGIANLVELGFGVTIGIFIAAFLLAPVLVPSISQLQGRTFWWPSRAPETPDAS